MRQLSLHFWYPSSSATVRYQGKSYQTCELKLSQILHEVIKLHEIKISHASVKRPPTIQVIERSHAALTRILKLNSNQALSNWHRYFPLATFVHNTPFHTPVGCSPTALFHGIEPMKPLDLRFYSDCVHKSAFNYDFVESLRDDMLKKFSGAKESLDKSSACCRRDFDQNARANQLKTKSYNRLLNPKLKEQSFFSTKLVRKWMDLYRVENVLTDSN